MVTKPRLRRWTPLLIVLALLLIGLTAGAAQPWTANHFGYALRGDDGLPTYVFMYGRRYQSPQVCAGAGWCLADQQRLHMPRCWTQADLTSRNEWPLSPVGTMFTLFGAPRTILSPSAGAGALPGGLVIADGANCYVTYGLEGGP